MKNVMKYMGGNNGVSIIKTATKMYLIETEH